MKLLTLFSLLSFIVSFSNCNRLQFAVGKKEIKEEKNSEGELIKKTIIKIRPTSFIIHPHSTSIKKTKTWAFQNGELVQYTSEKRKLSVHNWDGELLKFKKKSYSNGKELNK